MLLALVSLVLQQPQVTIQVDRNDVLVGAELTVTVIVSATGAEPVLIGDLTLAGLELLDQREQTRVTMQDEVPRRVTTRELTLRAVRAGLGEIGPVQVRQGEMVVQTASIPITVHAPDVGDPVEMSPRVETLLSRPPPRTLTADDVALLVHRSADTVLVGDQLDMVVVAWFPREIRARLRNPPVLEAPDVQGAWVYRRPTPPSVVASRNVAGRWYDLYVQHVVVFPLRTGVLTVESASVSYSVPLSGSFLSRDLRREARSEPSSVYVRPLPPVAPALAFTGSIGREIEIRTDVSAVELRRGDAGLVRIELSGLGNVSLWPEPAPLWPAGVTAYQQEVSVSITARDGLLGGTKAYQYFVVPDSVGTHRISDLRYTYFDTGRNRYVQLRAEPLTFVTPGDVEPAAPVTAARPLMSGAREQLPDRFIEPAFWWLWLLALAFPPAAVALVRVQWGRGRRGHVMRASHRHTKTPRLTILDAEFGRVLERLVPGAESKARVSLADALRAAGIDASLAAHAAHVRDRLRGALYGPEGGTDADELDAEVQEVLRALVRGEEPDPIMKRAVELAGLSVILFVFPALAQTPERLYEAGAARAAADSFAARAAEDPFVPAHWLNLGNALDRVGARAQARASWVHAGRLAPRARPVRRILQSAPFPDSSSEQLMWISPVTPGEALLGAAACWIVGWLLVARRARKRFSLSALLLAILLASAGGYVKWRYVQPVALVLRGGTPMRTAPYGTAAASMQFEEAAAVRLERSWGAWYLVSHGNSRGWVLMSELFEL